jgi:acetoin:2,6-dichlorophenolindophenol oxidoreductase subunit alpha
LMARRFKGVQDTVGATCIGDGATSTGAVHEAMNQAAIERLPLVLVLANNQYAYSTPTSRQFACASLLDRADAYGIQGQETDGTDLAACLKTLSGAVRRAREGQGPQLVVANLLRLCGHGEHDDSSYIDSALKESAVGRDCLKVAESRLLEQKWAGAELIESWRNQFQQHIDEAIATVQREPAPDPFVEKWHALASGHLIELPSASS